MKVHTISSNEDFYTFIKNWKPDIIVNDCLNTEADYIENLKSMVNRVVTLEDIGPGAELAHASINALYEDDTMGGNYYWGEKYVCLKDEFLIAAPSEYSEQVKNIVVILADSGDRYLSTELYNL